MSLAATRPLFCRSARVLSTWLFDFAIPTIDLDIIVVVLSLGFLDFEFVGDLFCPGVLGVALNGRFLFLGLDRTSQSDDAINRDNLDILGHHRKRAIVNDHLANVGRNLDVGRIV